MSKSATPNIIDYNPEEIAPKFTAYEPPVTMQALSTTSKHKNIRYRNEPTNNYNLRPKHHLIQHMHSEYAEDLLQCVQSAYVEYAEEDKAQHIFSPTTHINHIYDENGKKETIDSLLTGKNSVIWARSLSNEWGRLASDNDASTKGANTITFIPQSQVPSDKKVTYATMACDYRSLKDEKRRVRIAIGGDKLPYHDDAGSPAVELVETKILLNSATSDAKRGARFMCLDMKDHFLSAPMQHPEFMRVKLEYAPPLIRNKYNIDEIATNKEWAYAKIQQGVPRLRQAAMLAHKHLKNSLEPCGYAPIPGAVSF